MSRGSNNAIRQPTYLDKFLQGISFPFSALGYRVHAQKALKDGAVVHRIRVYDPISRSEVHTEIDDAALRVTPNITAAAVQTVLGLRNTLGRFHLAALQKSRKWDRLKARRDARRKARTQ